MPPRNTNLQTVAKPITQETAGLNIGGQVPAAMKRWVTFLSLDSILPTGASSVRLYLASVGVSNPSKASLIATGNRRMLIDLRATGIVGKSDLTPDGPPLMIPDQPNANAPLFSIAGGKWLGVYASFTSANIFTQFYDE